MENLELWWNGLANINKMYWIAACSSTLLFLLMFIISMVGGDSDAGHDGDTDISGDSVEFSSYLLSFKSILAFIIGGSWSGLAAMNTGMQIASVIILSLLSGIIVMLVVAFVLANLMKLQYDGSITMEKTIGSVGKVYLPIPENGKGQIEIVVNNSYKTYYASSEDGSAIGINEPIEVISIKDDETLLVRRQIELQQEAEYKEITEK